NETGNETGNETNQPPFPDATLPGTVDCGTATYPWIDDGTDASITCTITNPNPFDVMLGFSWILYPTTPPPLTFEYVLGEPGTETISATGTTQIEFTPVRNGPSDLLFPGLQGVPYSLFFTCSEYGGQNLCDSMTTPTATVEGEFQWTLGEKPQVDEPIDTDPTETKGGSGALVGGIIAVIALGALGAAFVLLRPRPDEDDWFEELESEDETEIISKPSNSMDEINVEDDEISRNEPPKDRRPSLFDEVDGRGEIEEFDTHEEEIEEVEAEVEAEAEAEESASEGDGITVDEEGTEWWEDEEGVWWYREDGWEDWAVWED
ncbi:MAG: hypothetical protein NLN65_06355, partial [Candidatus Poseidoniaceae archaeon]|nr:hypothetical protein [Candidatus Poseidoniaceae archaeon]